MTQTAKLFTKGRRQAHGLAAVFQFDIKGVFIRQDTLTGDVILSRKPAAWEGFFTAWQAADVPEGFLSEAERAQGTHGRDRLEGWRE